MKSSLLVSIAFGLAFSPATLSAQDVRSSNLAGATGGPPAAALGLNSSPDNGALDVYLKAPNGAPPVKGAVITLLTASGQSYEQLTPKADYAHFNELAAPNEFSVRVTVPGFAPAVLKVETKARYSAKLVFELQPLSKEDLAFAARLASLSPKAQAQLGKAMDALRVNDTAKARRPLDSLERMAPNNPEVNYLLGLNASKNHDEVHAKAYWTRTIELDPHHLQALFSLSDIALREKSYDEALTFAQRAVQIDPSSWRAHAILAGALSRKNNYAEALQHAERAFELGHSQAATVEPMLASLLAFTGNKTHATEILQSYLSDHPADDAARQQLTRIEKGEPASVAAADREDDSAVAGAATALLPVSNWLPPDVDANMPPVDSAGACNVSEILQGAGKRIEELVHNVDRYTATETVFHESINRWGAPAFTESRKFDYVATISEIRPSFFTMDEYRRADGAPGQFPGGVATLGLPSLALIFHPHNAENYEMVCEGLTHWDGVPVWQIHFRQRTDKPNTIRSYRQSLQAPSHAVALRGRAWIAADTYQLVRLETDLTAPVPEIKLLTDHIITDYGPVHFQDTNTDLWLPHSAEVFFDWNNTRIHRRHTFSAYLLFSVDNRQKISPPPNAPSNTGTASDNPAPDAKPLPTPVNPTTKPYTVSLLAQRKLLK